MKTKVLSENGKELRRLHPLWMLFTFGKAIKGGVFFCIFLSFILGLSSMSIFSKYGISLLILFVIYQISSILLQWKNFGYYIDEEEFFIKKGRLMTLNRHFPLENINGLNQNTPFFHRLFGLTSILIDAGSSDKNNSIKLEMIPFQEAHNIKKLLSDLGKVDITEEENTNDSSFKTSEKNEQAITSHHTNQKHYVITLKEILLASLTSLRLLFFLTLIYSVYSEVNRFFSVERYMDSFIAFFQSSGLRLTLGIIALVGLSITYGALKTYLQYGGFTVTSDPYRIFIEKGKLSLTNFSIPKEKVQALNITSNFIHKLLNIVKVKIISSADTDDEDIKASSILFPFVHKDKAINLVPQILPAFKIEKSMTRVPKSSVFVKLLRTLYIWLLLPAILLYFFPNLWYLAIIVGVFTLLSQVLSGLFSSYTFNGSFIQLKNGALSTKTFITSRDKIERLMLTETMIQRKMGLSSMKIITRSRPTKITTIHDIPMDDAAKYYSWYLEGISQMNALESSKRSS